MTITAKYPGTCKKCGGKIEVGQKIEWAKGEGAEHIECPKVEEAPHKVYFKKEHKQNYTGKIVKMDGKYYFVLRTSYRYIPEDGMSFGLGMESGYVITAHCREATDEEIAPLIAEEKKKAEEKEEKERLEKLAREIKEKGERPEGTLPMPEGEEFIIREFNIYGGGKKIIDDGNYLWLIQNNGADGDNWEYNNIQTGGAGAIGWRLKK